MPIPTFRAWGVRAAGNFGRGRAGDPREGRRAGARSIARRAAPGRHRVAQDQGLDALAVLIDVLAHCGQRQAHPVDRLEESAPAARGSESARFVALVAPRTLSPALAAALAADRRTHAERARQPDTAAVAALITVMARRAIASAPRNVCRRSRRSSALNRAARRAAELKAALRPFLDQVLAGEPGAPLLSVRNCSPRGSASSNVDAAAVRARFTSAVRAAEAARLQALDALVAFRDPALLDALPEAVASGDVRFLTTSSRRRSAASRTRSSRTICSRVSASSRRNCSRWRSTCSCSASRGRANFSTPCSPSKLAPERAQRQSPAKDPREQRSRSAVGGRKGVRPSPRRAQSRAREGRGRDGRVLPQASGRSASRAAGLQEPVRAVPHDLRRRRQGRPRHHRQRPRVVRAIAFECLRPEPRHRPRLSSHHRRDQGRPQSHRPDRRGQRAAHRRASCPAKATKPCRATTSNTPA